MAQQRFSIIQIEGILFMNESMKELVTMEMLTKETAELIVKSVEAFLKRRAKVINARDKLSATSFRNDYAHLRIVDLSSFSHETSHLFEKYAREKKLFLLTTPNPGMYVCLNSDKELCDICEENAITDAGRYYQEAPMQALDRLGEKSFRINNLNILEEEALKKGLNAVGMGTTLYTKTVAIEPYDTKIFEDAGTPKTKLKTKDVAIREKDSRFLAKGSLQAAFLLESGAFEKDIKSNLNAELIIYQKIAEAKAAHGKVKNGEEVSFKPLYIHNALSNSNNKLIAEIGIDGITVKKLSNNKVVTFMNSDGEPMHCKFDDEKFDAFKDKWQRSLYNKSFCDKETDAVQAFKYAKSKKEINLHPECFQHPEYRKERIDLLETRCKNALINQIDENLKKQIDFSNPEKDFFRYTKAARVVVNHLREGKIFDEKSLSDLKKAKIKPEELFYGIDNLPQKIARENYSKRISDWIDAFDQTRQEAIAQIEKVRNEQKIGEKDGSRPIPQNKKEKKELRLEVEINVNGKIIDVPIENLVFKKMNEVCTDFKNLTLEKKENPEILRDEIAEFEERISQGNLLSDLDGRIEELVNLGIDATDLKKEADNLKELTSQEFFEQKGSPINPKTYEAGLDTLYKKKDQVAEKLIKFGNAAVRNPDHNLYNEKTYAEEIKKTKSSVVYEKKKERDKEEKERGR